MGCCVLVVACWQRRTEPGRQRTTCWMMPYPEEAILVPSFDRLMKRCCRFPDPYLARAEFAVVRHWSATLPPIHFDHPTSCYRGVCWHWADDSVRWTCRIGFVQIDGQQAIAAHELFQLPPLRLRGSVWRSRFQNQPGKSSI